MIPYNLPITIRRGDTYELFFRVRTRVWNGTTNLWEPGPYRDLTGYTFLGQVKANAEDAVALLNFAFTVGNQAEPVNGIGSVLAKIGAAATGAIPAVTAAAVYDIRITEPDVDTFTYIEGAVTWKAGVSRA